MLAHQVMPTIAHTVRLRLKLLTHFCREQSDRDVEILKLASLDSISSLHAFGRTVEGQLHHCIFSTQLSLPLFVGLRLNRLEWFCKIEVSKFEFLVDDVNDEGYVYIEGQL